MNDIIKTITPNPDLVTDLSNENTSLTTKIILLEEEIKTLKDENSNLKDNIKTQLTVIEQNSIRIIINTLSLEKTKSIQITKKKIQRTKIGKLCIQKPNMLVLQL